MIPDSIQQKQNRNYHNLDWHPIARIKNKIYAYFDSLNRDFNKYDDLSPEVTTQQNFDNLLIPEDHPSRSKSDTYYINSKTLLRSHTTAHQLDLLKTTNAFLVTGDVYRKDTIDRYHYPVFHQMEGLYIVPEGKDPIQDLKEVLSGLVNTLFPGCNWRMNDDYFPFTNPSFEVEVEYNGKWIEILGSGIVQPKIMKAAGKEDKQAWAFGLGLERLAMILFEIPDIRLFWTADSRFKSQFQVENDNIKFEPYSQYESQTKDIAGWVKKGFNEVDFHSLCRDIDKKDQIENIELVDKFRHPRTKKWSYCFRLTYRDMNYAITKAEALEIHEKVREKAKNIMELR